MMIRKAVENDLVACALLLEQASFHHADNTLVTNEFLSKYLDSDLFLVAEREGEIIGCIIGEVLKAEGSVVWYFVVDANHRKQGVGQALMQAFEHAARQLGSSWVSLMAKTTDNTERFYERAGFVKGQLYRLFEKEW